MCNRKPATRSPASFRRIVALCRGSLFLCWLCPQIALFSATAQTPAPSHNLTFAPPPAEGVLSVGIYDPAKKLVRTLKKAADIDTFQRDSDGLIISWDGNDDTGKPLPAGHYFARGVLTGEVKIEGVAFHLNDWIIPGEQVRRLLDACLTSDDQTAALVDTGSLQVLLFDPKQSFTKTLPLNGPATRLKSSGAGLLLIDPNRLALLDLSTNQTTWQQQVSQIQDADRAGDQTITIDPHAITINHAGATRTLPGPGSDLWRCTILPSSIVVASHDGKVWRVDGQSFIPIDSGDHGDIIDLSAGKGDAFWLLTQIERRTWLTEVDLSGRQIREIALPDDLQGARHIAASRQSDTLLIGLDALGGQRIVGLRFENANEKESVWQKWLDRSVVPFTYFALNNGQVIPTSSKTDSAPVSITPANNPMNNSHQAPFQLIVTEDATGAWIANSDGLPLFQVSKTQHIKQLAWIPDGANGLRVFVSDGRTVEEYHVTHLDRLYRFDAGSLD